MKKRRITSLMLAATIALTPASAFTHGGKTDSSGVDEEVRHEKK